MVEKKTQTDNRFYAGMWYCSSVPLNICVPGQGAAYANVMAVLLDAELLTQSEEYKLFIGMLYTRTTVLWLQISHTKRWREGHLLLLVLLNPITSSNLPF